MPRPFPGHRRPVAALAWLAAAVPLAAIGPAAIAAAPTWPGTTWATTTPAQVGMDPALLGKGVGFAAGFGGAGMVVRQGYVVASWGDTDALANVRSVAKSYGSILLGVAMGDGLVQPGDEARDLLPSLGLPPQANAATGWLPRITLEQLATHTAGFADGGGYGALVYEPGTAWNYTDGGANWLGDTLTAAFAADLADVLRERVLDAIGVPRAGLRWGKNGYRPEPLAGNYRRAINSSIYVSVDAMARTGLLMARGGVWDGARVLPQAYVRQAASVPESTVGLEPYAGEDPPTTAHPTEHYGLLWWNNADGTMPGLPTGAFWAWGLDDALILVVPSLDLVVARHGPRIEQVRFGSYAQIAPFLSPIARSVRRANAAPVVSAGPDLRLAAPGELTIAGRFDEDGLPGTRGPVVLWTRPSGPAAVAFAPANRAVTSATFPAAGTYKLKLTVGDGSLKGYDTVVVRVGGS